MIVSYISVGLYDTGNKGEWYLMRRQSEKWRDAECRLIRKNMNLISKWENVSHAVDISNLIKEHYRQFSWFAHGNTISTNDVTIQSDHVKDMITEIINRENEAHQLAKENINVQNI